jgi:hypothetical protein
MVGHCEDHDLEECSHGFCEECEPGCDECFGPDDGEPEPEPDPNATGRLLAAVALAVAMRRRARW